MRKSRFSEEQIIEILKEQQVGLPNAELCHNACVQRHRNGSGATARAAAGGRRRADCEDLGKAGSLDQVTAVVCRIRWRHPEMPSHFGPLAEKIAETLRLAKIKLEQLRLTPDEPQLFANEPIEINLLPPISPDGQAEAAAILSLADRDLAAAAALLQKDVTIL